MVHIILNRIENFEYSNVKAIIFKGSDKFFCAGGDLKAIYEDIKLGRYEMPKRFFQKEFEMDLKLRLCKIPTIALLNGFTMGGGMGLAMGCMYRISNETLSLAMPETSIGFFPDVGSTSYLISTPPHKNIGIYLGLTGERMNVADAMYCGFITHYVPMSKMKDLESELETNDISNNKKIEEILKKYSSHQPTITSTIKDHERLIIDCFGFNTVEEIFANLEEKSKTESKKEREWCIKTLNTLKSKSPTSLKITLAILQRSKSYSYEDTFKLEYRVAVRMMKSHDFSEGVRAILVDKDRDTKWNPSKLEDVKEDYIESFFKSLEDEWKVTSK